MIVSDLNLSSSRATRSAVYMSVLLLTACTTTTLRPDVKPAPISAPVPWMVGCWETQDGGVTETWQSAGKQLMFGHGVTTKDGRAVFFEQLRIEVQDDSMAFYAYPLGRGPTQFKLTSEGTGRVTFEAPNHDYPQRVIYETSSSGLNAIASQVDGSRESRWAYRPCSHGAG